MFWKKYQLWTKASLLRILQKKLRALHALEELEPLFKIFYTVSVRKSLEKLQTNIWKI